MRIIAYKIDIKEGFNNIKKELITENYYDKIEIITINNKHYIYDPTKLNQETTMIPIANDIFINIDNI